MRVLAAVPMLLSLALLGLAVLGLRREGRVRPGFDVVRLIVAAGTAAIIGAAMAIDTPVGLTIGAAAAGIVLGGLQGASMQIRLTTGGAFARRGTLAVGAWAAATALTQVAGIANRANLVEIGLAASFFSAGMTLGLMVGRSRAITQARAQVAAVPVAVIAIAVAFGGLGGMVGRSEPAEAQGGPACPGSLAGVPLAESKPETNADQGTQRLTCRWEYTTTEEGVLYGFGFTTAGVEWAVTPEGQFNPCPVKDGENVVEPNATGDGRNGRVISNTFHLRGDFFESGGEPFAGGEGEAMMQELMAAAQPLAQPCVPEGTGSGLECSASVGGFPNSYSSQFDTTDEGEAKGTGFGCNFSAPYLDAKGSGSVTVGWTEAPIEEGQGYHRCGNPPTTSGPYHYLDSPTKAAGASYSVQEGMPIGPLEAEAKRLVEAAAALAAPCPNREGAAAGAESGDEAGATVAASSDDPSSGGSEDEDDVDPSSALGGALVGLLGSIAMAGTTLGERGISMTEVRDAFRRKGRAGIAELLGRRTIDVTLTGDEARAVLERGVGQDIRIPDDQQWDVFVQAGDETAREGHRGVWGRVRGIPVVVEDAETGEISISVDVDVIDADIEVPEGLEPPEPPAPPAPPPAPADTFTPDEIDKALDKGLDDIARLGEPAPPPAPPPIPGGVEVSAFDVDGDGVPEAVGWDTDGDGKLDTAWIRGRGAVRPGDPGWDETVPGGKPVPEPPAVEPPAVEPMKAGAAGLDGLDIEDGPVAAGARAAAEAAGDAGAAEAADSPPAPSKFHGSQAAETGASDDLNDPFLRGGATVWHDDYLDWLKQVEQANPDATPQQILARLHDVQYHDDHAKGTIPGTSIKAFEQGPDTDGWDQVQLPTKNAPQFVLGPNGEKIHIGHTYAGVRSDFNRGDQSDARRDFMRWFNTHGGDSAQEVIMPLGNAWDAGKAAYDQQFSEALKHLDRARTADWAPPDQRRGNTVGTRLSDFYRDAKNKDVPASEAMRRIFRDLAVDPLDREGE